MSSLEQRITVYKQAVFDINNRTMRKLRIEKLKKLNGLK